MSSVSWAYSHTVDSIVVTAAQCSVGCAAVKEVTRGHVQTCDLAMLQIKDPEECKLYACVEGCGDVGSRGCRRCRGRLYDYGGGGGGYHVGLQRDAWREDDDVEERLYYTALNHVSMFCVYTWHEAVTTHTHRQRQRESPAQHLGE